MNRITIQLGTMAIAAAFSTMAFAAGIEVKPRERVNELAVPGAFEAGIKPTAKGKSIDLNFDSPSPAKGTGVNTNIGQQTCPSNEALAAQFYARTQKVAPEVTKEDILADLKGGYVNIESGCGNALTSMKSDEALANEFKISTDERHCLSEQSPAHHPKLKQCLVEANQHVFGMTPAQATENEEALESCNYNNQKTYLN